MFYLNKTLNGPWPAKGWYTVVVGGGAWWAGLRV